MYRIIATASLIVLASVSAARSETVLLNVEPGAQLKMEAPPGFCPLRAQGRAAERELLAFAERNLQGTTKLLAYFMPCDDYANLGTDKYLGEMWILVLVPLDQGRPTKFPGYTRERFLEEVSKTRAVTSNAGPSAETLAKLEQLGKEFGLDGKATVRPLGVLGRDSNAIYQGNLQRFGANAANIIASVVTTTFAANYFITINAYGVYDDAKTIEEMLAYSKDVAQDFLDANERSTR